LTLTPRFAAKARRCPSLSDSPSWTWTEKSPARTTWVRGVAWMITWRQNLGAGGYLECQPLGAKSAGLPGSEALEDGPGRGAHQRHARLATAGEVFGQGEARRQLCSRCVQSGPR